MFNVVRKSPIPLGDQIVERVVELIESGRLPAGVDSERLCVDARSVGILLAKGAMFSISSRCSDYLRINAAYGSEPTLTQFLASHCEAAA